MAQKEQFTPTEKKFNGIHFLVLHGVMIDNFQATNLNFIVLVMKMNGTLIFGAA